MFCNENRNKSCVPKDGHCTKICEELNFEKEGWQCYYKEMLTIDNIDQMQELSDMLNATIGENNHLITNQNTDDERSFFLKFTKIIC